jgi:hypothetical protein
MCPHCETTLEWRFMRMRHWPDEADAPPYEPIFVCPKCRGRLRFNAHPLESKYWGAIGLLNVVLWITAEATRQVVPSWVWLIAALVASISIIEVRRRKLRNWPRYVAFAP